MSSQVLISCQGLCKSYGTTSLFSDISFGIFSDEHLGLIGPNGSGKTTLLKILAELESPSDGKVSRKRNLQLVYLAQEDLLDPNLTIKETLFQTMPAAIENWASDRNIRTTVEQMGFSDLEQKVETLSGGWRKRLAIAEALIRKPDLLFMDEPTNHLDLEGILWLEDRLKRADFAFVLVSHDRVFLENTSNRILELNKAYPKGYIKVEGNYSAFLEQREAMKNAQSQLEQSLSSKVRREREWLQRGPKARTTKAKSRIDQAGALEKELSEVSGRNRANQIAQIDFEASGRRTKKLIGVRSVALKLGEKHVFENLNLTLTHGTCLGVLGRNGSGKSSLIKLLSGEIKPDAGTIKQADWLKIVTFGQKREQLDQNQRLKEALTEKGGDQVMYRGRPIHIAAWAKRFLFSKEQLALPVAQLSGGEQARVLIANLMLKPADILLLDEPTNDLDIPTLEVLEDSLLNFPGALVLITHDRFLLDRLSDQLLHLEGNGTGKTAFYADYYQWIQAQEQAFSEKTTKKKQSSSTKDGSEPETKKLSYEERKELSRITDKIEKAQNKVAQLKREYEAPDITSDPERLLGLSRKISDAEEAVDQLYQRWETLDLRS